MIKKYAVVLVVVLSLSGCAARPIHPGALNKFDSSTYDALLVTASVIQSTQQDLIDNKFPASIMPGIKTALNNLIQGYEALKTTLAAYHNAGASATQAQVNAVVSAQQQVASSTQALASAKAGKL